MNHPSRLGVVCLAFSCQGVVIPFKYTFPHEKIDMDEIQPLDVFAVIAFDGTTLNGLRCHPDGVHIVYPIGNKICIKNQKSKKMTFLSGHTNIISTLNISPNGKYIGSGQINQIGFKTFVILWDFETRKIISSHELHKVRVESIIFSCDDSLMASLGGRDCGQLVVWNNDTGAANCTSPAAKVTVGDAVILVALNRRNNSFVTGGNGNLRLWSIHPKTHAPTFVDVVMGKLKRYILSIVIDGDDKYGYCGTTSGDIVKISIDYPSNPEEEPMVVPTLKGCYAKCGQWKKNSPRPETLLYCSGIQCLLLLENGILVVGAGDGAIEIIQEIKWKTPLPKTKLYSPVEPNFKCVKARKLKGAITSMQLLRQSNPKSKDRTIMVATKNSEIYTIDLNTFQVTLIITCHTSAINSVAFPKGISEVFATAGKGDIRIWCLKTCQELLRIQVSNFECHKVKFANDGRSIVSCWGDSCIRAFKPLSGKLIYCIVNTHHGGITTLEMTKNGQTLISGGKEGQVRIWSIDPQKQTLVAILKEHKSAIMALKINHDDREVVSAGADGFCIIWDIIRMCRRQVFFAYTIFTAICYDPLGCQILTGGTDKRISYWEAGNGLLIRELEASKTSTINTIDIDSTGDFFVSAGNDQLVKLWKYNEGIYTHIGTGHSGFILSAAFSPDRKYIVSTSASGSIFIWKFPTEHNIKCSEQSSPKSDGLMKKSEKVVKSPESVKSIKSLGSLNGGRKDRSREENISTMNTARSSIITSCSCTCNKDTNKSKKGNITCEKCEGGKKDSKPASVTGSHCTPPAEVKDCLF